jgi:hypothetical protein
MDNFMGSSNNCKITRLTDTDFTYLSFTQKKTVLLDVSARVTALGSAPGFSKVQLETPIDLSEIYKIITSLHSIKWVGLFNLCISISKSY